MAATLLVLAFARSVPAVAEDTRVPAAAQTSPPTAKPQPSTAANARPPAKPGTVKTQIVTGKRGHETTTEFRSDPAGSGLQIGSGQDEAPSTKARRIAVENLETGRVSGPDSSESAAAKHRNVQTTIRVEEVIVRSQSDKSKACVQIGVVGNAPRCN